MNIHLKTPYDCAIIPSLYLCTQDVADAKVVASVQHMGRGSLRYNTHCVLHIQFLTMYVYSIMSPCNCSSCVGEIHSLMERLQNLRVFNILYYVVIVSIIQVIKTS